jgi:hypothetical protein
MRLRVAGERAGSFNLVLMKVAAITIALLLAVRAMPQPASPEPLSAINNSARSTSIVPVDPILAKAFKFEREYRWQEAHGAYSEALRINSESAEAREGRTRANTLIRALIHYDKYIEFSERFAKLADFQGAIRLFNEAMAVKPSYLVNSDRVQGLHVLLMAQNKPVDVAFGSDGKTWVSISGFRAPEKFKATIVKMLPGDYAAIGRRHGFRDVEVLIQVRGGVNPPVINVVCSNSVQTSGPAPDDQFDRATQARHYQVELARRQAKNARVQAEFREELQEELRRLTAPWGPPLVPNLLDDPVQLQKQARFLELIKTAQKLSSRADFQGAILFFKQALASKPEKEYIENEAEFLELQATLMDQNQPVDVIINSDGKTDVSVMHFYPPSRDKRTSLRLMPGDYVVVGTRKGYRDVTILAEIRNGAPPPVFTVVCDIPSEETKAKP